MTNQNEVINSSSQRNSKLATIVSIFSPSALGMCTYIVVFIISVIVSQPSEYKTAITNFNINDLKGTFIYGFVREFTKAANSQIVNQLAVYAFWVIVALVIYLIASRLTKNVDELADDLTLRQYIWPKNKNKNEPLKEFMEKLGFHIVMLLILIFYLFKASPALLDLWKRSNLLISLNFHSLRVIIVLFIFELLVLHIAVILVRLFLTRKRIISI